jgi:hypothetical protein
MPGAGPRLSAGRSWRRCRAHVLIVALGTLLALGAAGAGVLPGPGGGAARAVSRPFASPASCGPTQAACPAQAVVGTGAWCWFADPRAVHINRDGIDEVVVGWLTATGQVMVQTIDAQGRARQTEVAHVYADDHNSPTIMVEPDNRITVYWSVHNGARLYYETTLRPADISSWSHWQVLPSNTPGRRGFTYPNPVILPAQADRHYLFWRGGNWEPSFSTRSNTGQWSPARVLIDFPGRRPYTKVASNGRDRIALAFTDGHPDNNVTSIYFAEIHGGGLYSAAGHYLGALGSAPIVPSAQTIVYDARANGNVRSWLQDVAFDRAGHPIVAYSIYPHGRDGQYWYARWNGRRWLRHLLVDAGPSIAVGQPHYLGGMVLDQARPGIVYLSAMVAGQRQLERWITQDGGHAWTVMPMTSGDQPELRPVVAQELPGVSTPASTIFVLRGRYTNYWHFNTAVTMFSSRFQIRQAPAAAAADRGQPRDLSATAIASGD